MVYVCKMNERFILLIDLLGINRSEFSKRTGISLPVISHIASGRNKLSLEQLMKIEEVFPQVSYEWLVYGKGKWQKEDENKKVKTEINLHLHIMEQDVLRIQHELQQLQHKISELSERLNQ